MATKDDFKDFIGKEWVAYLGNTWTSDYRDEYVRNISNDLILKFIFEELDKLKQPPIKEKE